VSSERLAGALENCRLTVAFGLGRASAEMQARHIGKADPFAVKEAALTYTQHTQYLGIGEQFETWTQDIQNLSPRMAYVKLHDQEAVKIKTLTVPPHEPDPKELAQVLGEYKRRYQRSQEEAEKAIASLVIPAGSAATDAVPPSSRPAYTNLFHRPAPAEDNPAS
jgi:hypothetical protein